MPGNHLLSITTALRALIIQHPRISVHGDFGTAGIDQAFLDALVALVGLVRLKDLYQATTAVTSNVRLIREYSDEDHVAAINLSLPLGTLWMQKPRRGGSVHSSTEWPSPSEFAIPMTFLRPPTP